MKIYTLSTIGLIGIIVGVMSFRYVGRINRCDNPPPHWNMFRVISHIFGFFIAVGTWWGTYYMSYPYAAPDGPGWALGIPFFVAYVDSAGHDHVGATTFFGAIGNTIFWFLLPSLLLAVYGK